MIDVDENNDNKFSYEEFVKLMLKSSRQKSCLLGTYLNDSNHAWRIISYILSYSSKVITFMSDKIFFRLCNDSHGNNMKMWLKVYWWQRFFIFGTVKIEIILYTCRYIGHMVITVKILTFHLIESYFLTIYTAWLSSNKTLSVDVFYCIMINIR